VRIEPLAPAGSYGLAKLIRLASAFSIGVQAAVISFLLLSLAGAAFAYEQVMRGDSGADPSAGDGAGWAVVFSFFLGWRLYLQAASVVGFIALAVTYFRPWSRKQNRQIPN